MPNSVVSLICDPDATCQITPGISIDLSIVFVAATSADAITPTIHIFIQDSVAIVPPTTIADGCANITPGCPIVAGNTYTYSVEVPSDNLPVSGVEVELDVELSVVSVESGEALTCFRFPVAFH